MAKYVLVVPSSAKDGRDDEYNAWYNDVHIHDLLAIPGITSGRRFVPSPSSPMPPPANYLALYEIECDDVGAVMAELNARAASGKMQLSDAINLDTAKMWVFEQTVEVAG